MKQIKQIHNACFIPCQLVLLTLLFLLPPIKSTATDKPSNKSNANFKEELIQRYGKVTAFKISEGIVERGFTKNMVFHAKGTPYLIEEPYGKGMDFEILFYKDMIVFIEYGIVNFIKYPKGVEKPTESGFMF